MRFPRNFYPLCKTDGFELLSCLNFSCVMFIHEVGRYTSHVTMSCQLCVSTHGLHEITVINLFYRKVEVEVAFLLSKYKPNIKTLTKYLFSTKLFCDKDYNTYNIRTFLRDSNSKPSTLNKGSLMRDTYILYNL